MVPQSSNPPGGGGEQDPPPSPASLSSIELLRRAREGDDAALDRLLQRYLPTLRRWAGGRLPLWARERVDTDDMIQDTVVKTLATIETFEHRGEGALLAYLRQALRNRIVDEVRRARRQPRRDEIDADPLDPAPSPLEQSIGRQAAERYDEALNRLSEQDRQAVVTRIELGLDYDEVARALDKPSRNAARMAVSRALVRLAHEMEHEG